MSILGVISFAGQLAASVAGLVVFMGVVSVISVGLASVAANVVKDLAVR